MSPASRSRTGSRSRACAAVLGLTLFAGGCADTGALVGIRDAPTEQGTGSALTEDAAQQVAARVLDEAEAARAATGKGSEAAQGAVLTGTALAVARAAAATGATAGTPAPEPEGPLARRGDPLVLALSEGRTWPRAMLVSTDEADGAARTLHVLLTAAAAEPYKVAFSVPMLPGTEVPSLGELADGAALVPPADGEGMTLSPDGALGAYAAALAKPKPKTSEEVATDDAFAGSLAASAAQQKKQLDSLAKYTQVHRPVPPRTIAFRLADGGAVVFGQLDRTEAITATAKETSTSEAPVLRVPKPYADIVGATTAKKSFSLKTIEALTLVVPPAGGKVGAVGATAQVESGTAR